MRSSLLQELGIIDCALLIKNKHNRFSIVHSNNSWFLSLFPDFKNETSVEMENKSIYLNDFLIDANEFWQLENPGRVNSGIWSEQTDNGLWHLEASAITHAEIHYLVITNIENQYTQRQGTLQLARELLLSNDKILEQHELVYKRIESLTSDVHSLIDIQSTIKDLMDNTEFGIAIIDKKMDILEQNSALFKLFDTKINRKKQPVDIVLDLCRRQFPEFQRVIETGNRWSGEIYWMEPEKLSRWIHLTISPVTNSDAELTHWLFVLTDVSREKYLQQSNEKLTYFDLMTSLPNRQYFWQSLENAINTQSSFFLLQINIKNLKRINEVYGYAAGDNAIKEVISRLTGLLNDETILARLGGNELALMLNNTSQKECQHLAMKLITAAGKSIIQEKYECNVTINIGAAHYPNDESNAEELMKQADLAAFFANDMNNKQLCFFSEGLKENSKKRIELEAALRLAVTEQQFELYLQPVYDLSTGNMVKAEALIRWNRPNVGIVAPDEFIHLAEQTGLIIPIGQWVINEAIRMLEILHQKQKNITMAVNLSPIQIKDRHLFTIVHDAIAKSTIDAGSFLELELTESVLIDDFSKILLFLNEVRKLGVTISIDDFGTGYSSLSYLQKLPIDYLKIDRSFISELPMNESNNAIVIAIMAMAKGLKLKVVAEGVENDKQRQFLQNNSCQSAQGYLFSKPIPFNEFIQLSNTLVNY